MPPKEKISPEEEKELLWAEFERSMKRPVMERIEATMRLLPAVPRASSS